MGAKQSVELRSREQAGAHPEIVYGEMLGDFKDEIQNAIAHRAYEFFEARGRQHGRDLDDWFRSEVELLHPLKVNIWESGGEATVTAEIPGFRPEELKIGIEPRRVTLWGQLRARDDRHNSYPSRAPVALLHTIDLPAEVDAQHSSATFADGLLKLIMPRAGSSHSTA